jgi:putative CocE/NonD family hydrolase
MRLPVMADTPGHGVEIEKDAPAAMRDGAVLRADIYRPSTPGRFPSLLCRTPYDKSHPRYVRIAGQLAHRGYIAIVQDIRGRHASDGEWSWHMTAEGAEVERRDGYDACAWAGTVSRSDGQVGTWGNSYPSWLIWQMASAQPPALKAVFASGFSTRVLDCTYGIFETGIRLRWQHQMAVSSRRRAGDGAWPQTEAEALWHWDNVERGKWLWHLPLDTVPDHLFGPTAAMQRQYWADIAKEVWALDRLHPRVTVPTCSLTGWWDRISGTIGHFAGMRRNSPAATRSAHRLIVGPWVHDIEGRGDWAGPRDYGPLAPTRHEDHLVRWYDYHLKGVDNGLGGEKPAKLFILNDNRWRFAESWPPAGMEERSYFLHSGGGANTPAGDGSLSRDTPGAEPPDRFVSDPADPVMSLVDATGQASCCDQRPLAGRRDILVYQTPPLAEDVLLAGPVRCHLFAASDAPDTDFVARLIEVGADGLAINISQGIRRARYRLGYDREVLLTPGEPAEFVIEMLAVGIRFRRGSRIRLDIASADFPSFDRNHQTGKPFQSDPELRVARQTVLHDHAHPSRIVLPVIDERAGGLTP